MGEKHTSVVPHNRLEMELQPRHVPRPGMKTVTFPFTGQHSNRATQASIRELEFLLTLLKSNCPLLS